MKSQIYEEIKNATKLAQVAEGLIKVLVEVKTADKNTRIGYVSGIISSDGDHKISHNMDILEKYANAIREKEDFEVFSGVDVFRDTIYSQLEETEFEREYRENKFVEFWRIILKSGNITDIYMTPRWKESEGAKDEYEIAKVMKIKIHYVDESIIK